MKKFLHKNLPDFIIITTFIISSLFVGVHYILADTGGASVTVDVNQCYPSAEPPGYGGSCSGTAQYNSCGDAGSSTGVKQCDGSCQTTAPNERAGYGAACTGTPDTNSCGDVGSSAGSKDCNGSCITPTKAERVGYDAICTGTPDTNSCGDVGSSSGRKDCNGSCITPTKAERAGYGASCTGTPDTNSCGDVGSSAGSKDCSGSCVTPFKAERPGYGASCTGTAQYNSCGVSGGTNGTKDCSGSCVTPDAPYTSNGSSCTGTANTNSCGMSGGTSGTYDCSGSCITPDAPSESLCSSPAVWSGYGLCSLGVKSGTCTEQTGGHATTCASLGFSAGVNTTTSGCPTSSLSINPAIVLYNGRPTLTWGSTGSTSCTTSANWSTSGNLSGSGLTDALKANATFTLQCFNGGNSSSVKSVSVTVGKLDGVCALAHSNCTAGVSATPVDGATTWTWKCNGDNGGTNASCTENKPSGSISGADCTISPGANSCNTALTVNVSDATVGAATNVTKAGNVEVVSNATINNTFPKTVGGISVSYPSTTFFLNHNMGTLGSKTINASCAANTVWNGSICESTGSITGADCTILPGESTCTTSLILDVPNPVVGAATNVTKPTNVEVISNATINNTFPKTINNIVVSYPSVTFFLNHNTGTLGSKTINASCGPGIPWDVGSSACSKPPTLGSPTDTGVSALGATLGATITDLGTPATIIERGVCYDTSPINILVPKSSNTAICTMNGDLVAGAYTVKIIGLLSPSTFYYYRGYAVNTTGTGYSAEGTFTTLVRPPSAKVLKFESDAVSGRIDFGKSVKFIWQSNNSLYGCSITSDGIPPISMTDLPSTNLVGISFKPSKTTTYTLTCDGEGGKDASSFESLKIQVGKMNPKFNEF